MTDTLAWEKAVVFIPLHYPNQAIIFRFQSVPFFILFVCFSLDYLFMSSHNFI